MNDTPRPTRKPYVTPRVIEQGRVSTVTRQITPTPTGGASGLTDTFFDEF